MVTLVGAFASAQFLHLSMQPVLTGSMRPGIQPGDLALLRPVPSQEIRDGDIIAYLPPDRSVPVMHRIVSLTPEGIVTKGDANSVTDPWGRVRPRSATVERLVAVVPKVGFLIEARRTLVVIAGGVLLFAACAMLWPVGHRRDLTQPRDLDPSVDTTLTTSTRTPHAAARGETHISREVTR